MLKTSIGMSEGRCLWFGNEGVGDTQSEEYYTRVYVCIAQRSVQAGAHIRIVKQQQQQQHNFRPPISYSRFSCVLQNNKRLALLQAYMLIQLSFDILP